MRKTFKVKAPTNIDIPGNLILRFEFTPPPLLPWSWAKNAIEAILRVWHPGADISWEGTTATITVEDWQEKEFNVSAARAAAAEYTSKIGEAME